MDNKLRNVFVAAILMIAFSVSWYYLIYKPRQEKIDSIFVKNLDCKKIEKDLIDSTKNTTHFVYAVFYSSKRNSCVSSEYSVISTGADIGKFELWTTDLTTQERFWISTADTIDDLRKQLDIETKNLQ